MDVLAPEIQVIDGICYRINPGDYISNYEKEQYIEQDYEPVLVEPEAEEPEFEVEVDVGGRCRTSFHIPKVYFPYLIGSKGNTRKRLEVETRTRINVPKMGHDGDIVVTGADRSNVEAARRRINMIVLSARNRQPFTHFISFPFVDKSFKNGFENFKKEVLENYKERGIDETIFQSPDKLHLTLCTLVLCDDLERKGASAALEKCSREVVGPILEEKPLSLSMVGVEYMNDDPSEVDVLYGKVFCGNDTGLLQTLADGVVTFFVQQGLVEKQYEKVKLHVTLMNTLFRKESSGVEEGRGKRETFDARTVIRNFQTYFFGEANISSIDLSLRYSTSKTGYYQATASIPIS